MLHDLNKRNITLEWIGPSPDGNKKRVSLLIPQFNESKNSNFENRLSYFKCIAQDFKEDLDVILIDDGSSDDSLAKMKSFQKKHPNTFYLASITKNSNKVGALFLTLLAIKHEFVILSDFDTDIQGLELLSESFEPFSKDSTLMGCYYRMLPFEGSGKIFRFQQLEYSVDRSIYKFHQKEQSVRVMPGAGSCFKREILISIYNQHSGLRNGEDREATLIGLKMGYSALYFDKILALTRPPLSFKALVKQRVRWYLGYLETFDKEKDYYFDEMKKFSRIGIITITDIISLMFKILLPLLVLIVCVQNLFLLPVFILLIYVLGFFSSLNLLFTTPKELDGFHGKRTFSFLYYPIIKLSLDYVAWNGALISFIKKRFFTKNGMKSLA